MGSEMCIRDREWREGNTRAQHAAAATVAAAAIAAAAVAAAAANAAAAIAAAVAAACCGWSYNTLLINPESEEPLVFNFDVQTRLDISDQSDTYF